MAVADTSQQRQLDRRVAQSAKPIATALREWMTKEVLPSMEKAPSPKVPEGKGRLF